MRTIYIVGTCDTKYEELKYLKQKITENDVKAKLIDVSTTINKNNADISNNEIAKFLPEGINSIFKEKNRGVAIENMSKALKLFISNLNDLAGLIGIGGSGGTSLITPSMQELQIGVPKLMISTVASGNTASYIGSSDIMMMYSVVDFASINNIMEEILSNAANAISGMVKNKELSIPKKKSNKSIGLTMFGVTTPCVEAIVNKIEKKFECFVFHATGSGGKSLEKLVESNLIDGVIDITTTEVCDYLIGGVFPCANTRFDVFEKKPIPYFGSVGAVDMVNFHELSSVPEKYKKRNLYIHNKQVTLMRTTKEENRKIGLWIVNKLNKMIGKVRFFLPLKGVSLLDSPSQPFHNPEANNELFKTIEENFITTKDKKIIKVDANINDIVFVEKVIEEFIKINKISNYE